MNMTKDVEEDFWNCFRKQQNNRISMFEMGGEYLEESWWEFVCHCNNFKNLNIYYISWSARVIFS